MESMNRRQFLERALKIGVVVLNADALYSAEAKERPYRFLSSELSPEEFDAQKSRAIRSLQASIPNVEELKYLQESARDLDDESQMYLPSPRELEDVVKKSGAQLQELADSMEKNSSGLFVFADSDAQSNRFQRLYVLRKNENRDLHFVKGYKVSTSGAGFGNTEDSNKTPLGLHRIVNGKQGMYGEVVSGLNKYKDLFNHVNVAGVDHWFVRGFGRRSGGNDIAEVVTGQYLITGKTTPPSRGIRFHGTNRSGERLPDGTWKTFLGGDSRSGGCIRLSNTDIYDLGLSRFAEGQSKELKGTPVMIFATQRAIDTAHELSDTEHSLRPQRWQHQSNTDQSKQEGEDTALRARPQRWKSEK